MFNLLKIKPLRRYRIWLRYSDGKEGEIDLSKLVGKGIFKIWDNSGIFESVPIDGRVLLYGLRTLICSGIPFLFVSSQNFLKIAILI